MGAEMAVQGTGVGRVVDAVGIPLARRVEPGVKRRRDVPPFQHADVGRQAGVQGKGEFLWRNAAGRIEMHPLSQRVNARVGAGWRRSRPAWPRRSASGERFLQHAAAPPSAFSGRCAAGVGRCRRMPTVSSDPALSRRAAALAAGRQLGHSRFHLLHRMVTSSGATRHQRGLRSRASGKVQRPACRVRPCAAAIAARLHGHGQLVRPAEGADEQRHQQRHHGLGPLDEIAASKSAPRAV